MIFNICVSVRYAPNKLSKISWKQIENGAPELFIFLQTFSFHVDDYELMIDFYAQKMRSGQKSMFHIACDWLNHEVPNRCEKTFEVYLSSIIFPQIQEQRNHIMVWELGRIYLQVLLCNSNFTDFLDNKNCILDKIQETKKTIHWRNLSNVRKKLCCSRAGFR